MTAAQWVDLGRLGYEEAWARQREIADGVVQGTQPDTLLLVEHPPVLTLGANFHEENLRLSREVYAARGIEVVRTDRGGDVTYHGPGQLVAYPIFNLERHGRDLHQWMRQLEETVITVLGDYGLAGRRFPPHTGAWVGDVKIAAIGVKIRRWVSIHGLALNCESSAEAFDLIVPCGIRGYGVTSLTEQLGRTVTVDEVKPKLVHAFQRVFGLAWESAPSESGKLTP